MSTEISSIIIRFNDDRVIKGLDDIAEKQDITRNQLVINILQIFLSAKDNFIVDCLPIIVRSMVKDEIKNLSSTTTDALKDILISTIKLRRVTEKLDAFLSPEFEKIEYDQMKIDELLHLVELSEKEEND